MNVAIEPDSVVADSAPDAATDAAADAATVSSPDSTLAKTSEHDVAAESLLPQLTSFDSAADAAAVPDLALDAAAEETVPAELQEKTESETSPRPDGEISSPQTVETISAIGEINLPVETADNDDVITPSDLPRSADDVIDTNAEPPQQTDADNTMEQHGDKNDVTATIAERTPTPAPVIEDVEANDCDVTPAAKDVAEVVDSGTASLDVTKDLPDSSLDDDIEGELLAIVQHEKDAQEQEEHVDDVIAKAPGSAEADDDDKNSSSTKSSTDTILTAPIAVASGVKTVAEKDEDKDEEEEKNEEVDMVEDVLDDINDELYIPIPKTEAEGTVLIT